MNFRIRNPDGNEAEFETCETAYRQHLKRFEKDTRTDLWRVDNDDSQARH
jgi:hypothetical protein